MGQRLLCTKCCEQFTGDALCHECQSSPDSGDHQIVLRKHKPSGLWVCSFDECDLNGYGNTAIESIEALCGHMRNAVAMFEGTRRDALNGVMFDRRKALERIEAINE